jgi:DNA topoisomerase-1
MMIPLILESPNKIKKITSCLPKQQQYVVLASCGHIRRLADTHDGMGFALLGPPDHVAIDYVEEASKKKIITNLQKQCQGAPVIYLATDPDREGEAIAWHLMQVLGPHKEYYRIRFHSVTAKDILAALAAPTRLDLNLVWAQQTRQIMDKWIGFQVSPSCWKINAKSAGRVQSPALKLLVVRQREIDHFQPETYYTLAATFEVTTNTHTNTIMHANVPLVSYYLESPVRFADEAAAMTALRTIEQQCPSPTWVLACQEAETATHPPPPYTTMTMLQDCHTHARLKPDRAMAILQKLYEAGHITYHRTDSVALTAEGVFGARAAVENLHPHLLSAAPRNYLTRNLNAQEAHEAIRPTHFDLGTLPAAAAAADPAAAKIYRLIYLRTLATQCQPCLHTQYTLTYTSPPATFRTTESFLKEPGWKHLYHNHNDTDKKEKKNKKNTAPPPPPVWMRQAAATAATAARLDEFSLETKHTTPPPPFNSSSLIHTMEKLGIGRPSTYASIIAKLFANKYVFEDKKNQHLRPTPLAGTLVDFLEQHYHTHFMNLTYTQDMERQLDAIATGQLDWHRTMGTFLRQFPS